MKLTKEDYMRLSKERLAELLVEMDSHPIEPITIPTSPSTTPYPYVPYEPWKTGPTITYLTNSLDTQANSQDADSRKIKYAYGEC